MNSTRLSPIAAIFLMCCANETVPQETASGGAGAPSDYPPVADCERDMCRGGASPAPGGGDKTVGSMGGESPSASGGADSSGGATISKEDDAGGTLSGGSTATTGGQATGGSSSGGSPGCSKLTFCLDEDRDGFTSTCVEECQSPGPLYWTGTGAGVDCYDENTNARPSLEPSRHFTSDRGDGSFDYDCDGLQEPAHGIGSCLKLGADDREGWVDSIPPCGASGSFAALDIDGNCTVTTSVNACR